MGTNFQLDCSKAPQKCVSPKKIISPKKCKKVNPEKMFHMKNLSNPKTFLRECNNYVKIPNILTSENFGKFLMWKSICIFFFMSCKLEFIPLIRIQKKNLKDRHFRKKNSLFGFENCGKFSGNFGKCNALWLAIPLEEYVYKFSARLLKNSSQKRLPQKN